MTLSARNKLLMTVFVTAILFIIATAIITATAFILHKPAVPADTERLFGILDANPVAGYNFAAAFGSAVVLVLYMAVAICLVYVNFEKTQSAEIIYFALFLVGTMLEGIRIWLPAYNIWTTFSSVYILLGRFLFFGRMLATLALIFLVLLSINQNAHQEAERNTLIIATTAGVFAWIVPVDTMTIPSNCAVRFGYERLFIALSSMCFAAAFVAMRNQSRSVDSREYRTASNGYITLIAGYLMLTQADSILSLGAGTLLLVLGTVVFLSNLHRYYMWK